MQVSIKPYPSCHFAHGLIDCAIALKNDGLKADEIKSIRCFVDEVPISFICDPLEAKTLQTVLMRPNFPCLF